MQNKSDKYYTIESLYRSVVKYRKFSNIVTEVKLTYIIKKYTNTIITYLFLLKDLQSSKILFLYLARLLGTGRNKQ